MIALSHVFLKRINNQLVELLFKFVHAGKTSEIKKPMRWPCMGFVERLCMLIVILRTETRSPGRADRFPSASCTASCGNFHCVSEASRCRTENHCSRLCALPGSLSLHCS